MAIAFDNATNGGAITATSLTYSHVGGSGSNRMLFVGVISNTDTITGVTYAGVSLTFINKIQNGTGFFAHLYYLANPATGTNNVIISASASTTIGSHASSYSGAKQTGIPDASATTTINANATYTISTTTIADNSWVVSYCREDAGRVMTADANTVMRAEVSDGQGKHFMDTGLAVTPAGAKVIGGTVSGATPNWAGVSASFAPAVAVTANPAFLLNFV